MDSDSLGPDVHICRLGIHLLRSHLMLHLLEVGFVLPLGHGLDYENVVFPYSPTKRLIQMRIVRSGPVRHGSRLVLIEGRLGRPLEKLHLEVLLEHFQVALPTHEVSTPSVTCTPPRSRWA